MKYLVTWTYEVTDEIEADGHPEAVEEAWQVAHRRKRPPGHPANPEEGECVSVIVSEKR